MSQYKDYFPVDGSGFAFHIPLAGNVIFNSGNTAAAPVIGSLPAAFASPLTNTAGVEIARFYPDPFLSQNKSGHVLSLSSVTFNLNGAMYYTGSNSSGNVIALGLIKNGVLPSTLLGCMGSTAQIALPNTAVQIDPYASDVLGGSQIVSLRNPTNNNTQYYLAGTDYISLYLFLQISESYDTTHFFTGASPGALTLTGAAIAASAQITARSYGIKT